MSTTSHSSSDAPSSISFPSTIHTSADSIAFSFILDLNDEFPEGGLSEATIRSLRKAARILGEPVALTADAQLEPVNLSNALPDEGLEFEMEARPKGSWGSIKRLFRRSGRECARKRRRLYKENSGGMGSEYEVMDAEIGGRVSTDVWSEASRESRRPLVGAGRWVGAKGLGEAVEGGRRLSEPDAVHL